MIHSLIQALTEFIPVSSSLHLFLYSQKLQISDYALMHLATALVVIIYEFKTIFYLLFFKNKYLSINFLFITMITGFSLLLLKPFLISTKTILVTVSLSITSSFLLYFLFKKQFFTSSLKKKFSLKEVFFISIFQTLGSFSGVSRLGATSLSFFLHQYSLKESFVFSMILSIPLGIASTLYSYIEKPFVISNVFFYTFFFSLFIYPIAKRFFSKQGFFPFFIYRLIFSFLIIIKMLINSNHNL